MRLTSRYGSQNVIESPQQAQLDQRSIEPCQDTPNCDDAAIRQVKLRDDIAYEGALILDFANVELLPYQRFRLLMTPITFKWTQALGFDAILEVCNGLSSQPKEMPKLLAVAQVCWQEHHQSTGNQRVGP